MPRVTCDLLEAFHSKISSIEINVEEKMRKCPSVCGKDRPLIQSQLTLQEMESENSLELAMLKTQRSWMDCQAEIANYRQQFYRRYQLSAALKVPSEMLHWHTSRAHWRRQTLPGREPISFRLRLWEFCELMGLVDFIVGDTLCHDSAIMERDDPPVMTNRFLSDDSQSSRFYWGIATHDDFMRWYKLEFAYFMSLPNIIKKLNESLPWTRERGYLFAPVQIMRSVYMVLRDNLECTLNDDDEHVLGKAELEVYTAETNDWHNGWKELAWPQAFRESIIQFVEMEDYEDLEEPMDPNYSYTTFAWDHPEKESQPGDLDILKDLFFAPDNMDDGPCVLDTLLANSNALLISSHSLDTLVEDSAVIEKVGSDLGSDEDHDLGYDCASPTASELFAYPDSPDLGLMEEEEEEEEGEIAVTGHGEPSSADILHLPTKSSAPKSSISNADSAVKSVTIEKGKRSAIFMDQSDLTATLSTTGPPKKRATVATKSPKMVTAITNTTPKVNNWNPSAKSVSKPLATPVRRSGVSSQPIQKPLIALNSTPVGRPVSTPAKRPTMASKTPAKKPRLAATPASVASSSKSHPEITKTPTNGPLSLPPSSKSKKGFSFTPSLTRHSVIHSESDEDQDFNSRMDQAGTYVSTVHPTSIKRPIKVINAGSSSHVGQYIPKPTPGTSRPQSPTPEEREREKERENQRNTIKNELRILYERQPDCNLKAKNNKFCEDCNVEGCPGKKACYLLINFDALQATLMDAISQDDHKKAKRIETRLQNFLEHQEVYAWLIEVKELTARLQNIQ
jgi:hypothetical protein